MKWQDMTGAERMAFNDKHGLSNHPADGNVIDAAEYDLELLKSGMQLEPGALDWTIEPLKELGENELVARIQEWEESND